MHIEVDRDSGLVHHVKTTSANEHDVTATSELMHGEEETLHGDSGYIGANKRPEAIRKNISCFIACTWTVYAKSSILIMKF